MTDYLGFLTWWTVPDVMAPYKELKDAATRVGFPLDCVPKPPAPRHAWEKAANVGGQRGLLLETPTDLGNSVFIRHGVAPEVRLITRRVSDKAPALCRHLVREVTVATPGRADEQLSMLTVAVLAFDCTTQRADVMHLPDDEGWTNGNVTTITQDIEARRLALRDNADGNDVREGVRKLLEDLHRVGLRGTGGVYFVPDSAPNAEYNLKAMRAYIKALRPWVTGKLSPSCNIVRLHGEEAEHLREEIIESATEEFKRRLSDLADKVDPILHGRVNGRTADKIAFAATEDLLKIQSAVAAYRDSLRDDFASIGDMLVMAQTAVTRAMGEAQ
jgi:hypothetical protein